QQGSTGRSDNFSLKLDRRISDRQNLYGRVSWNNVDNDLSNYFRNLASPNAGWSGARNRSITLDDTYTTAGWVFHGNAGYAYHANPRDSASRGFDLASLGFPASYKQAAQFPIFPRVEPAGLASLGGDPTFVIGNKFETYTWIGDATRLIGAHTVKTGGVFRLNRV